MARWLERFHMKLFEIFSGLVTRVDSLTKKITRNFKMTTIEHWMSTGPCYTVHTPMMWPWVSLPCQSEGLTLWGHGNNSYKKVNKFKALEDDDSGDHDQKEESSTWKHDEEETSERGKSQSFSKRKAVVLDLRTSLAAQLHFLVNQEDPGPSHPLTRLWTEYQSGWCLCLFRAVLEILQQHGNSLESDRPQ